MALCTSLSQIAKLLLNQLVFGNVLSFPGNPNFFLANLKETAAEIPGKEAEIPGKTAEIPGKTAEIPECVFLMFVGRILRFAFAAIMSRSLSNETLLRGCGILRYQTMSLENDTQYAEMLAEKKQLLASRHTNRSQQTRKGNFWRWPFEAFWKAFGVQKGHHPKIAF